MKERAVIRRTANIEADFIYNKVKYSGKVINLSEKGLYIKTDSPLPFRSIMNIYLPLSRSFDIQIPYNGDLLNVKAKIRRIENSDGVYNGIGAEIEHSPGSYIELVDSL